MLIDLSSEQIPQRERIDTLYQTVSQAFCPMDCECPETSPAEFQSHIKSSQLENFGLAQVQTSPLTIYRKPSHIAVTTDDYYLVKFQLQGQGVFIQCGQQALLKPGDFVLCSTSDPYELQLSDANLQAVLTIPRTTLDELISAPEQYVGRRMAANVGANGLLNQFVSSVLSRIDHFESALSRRIEANILDLLVTSLSFGGQPVQRAARSSKVEHLYRIKRLINQHLENPQLTPAWIAEKQGISTRYLHMLFKDEPTSVSRCIQRQRLDACKRCLSTPEMNGLSIVQIAYRWGFSDAAHFNRCFKALNGVTPRAYRKASLEGGYRSTK